MPPTIIQFQPNLPRQEFSLNGLWQVTAGSKSEPPRLFGSSIPVPSLIDCSKPEIAWQIAESFWYRKEFETPPLQPDSALFLRIGQAQYGTTLYLNGTLIGGSINCYTSQEYRIDQALRNGTNVLLVNVGHRKDLPPESAVGNDQEKETFIPGIWGDVELVRTGLVRIVRVQALPNCASEEAEIRCVIENLGSSTVESEIRCAASDSLGKKSHALPDTLQIRVQPGANSYSFRLPIREPLLWSPESPILYTLSVSLSSEEQLMDNVTVRFGMRDFKIANGDFFLNGKRILLRGGNIAFHRFLSDPQRRLLPWNREWIKSILIDIPKAHNFNYFRFHLGQAYALWYELADEYGMMIQNEWQFWRSSGTEAHIINEFSDWVYDNCNHPSIVMWDATNECDAPAVEESVIPKVRTLDPTRPWEPNDVRDHHPYIYSLGPVLIDRRFGFSDSIEQMRRQTTPLVVNEFLWWWTNNAHEPTALMKDVVERWLGPNWTRQQLVERQSWLAQELIELFRRFDADAIQPFVYLSNGNGPTGNWFEGDVKDLRLKPLMRSVRNAFSPVGTSVELYDRHFSQNEMRIIPVHLFNDTPTRAIATWRLFFADSTGMKCEITEHTTDLEPTSHIIESVEVHVPSNPGWHILRAEIYSEKMNEPAFSEKSLLVCGPVRVPGGANHRSIALLTESNACSKFLASQGFEVYTPVNGSIGNPDVILVQGESLHGELFNNLRNQISEKVRGGALLCILEPYEGVDTKAMAEVVEGIMLSITKRYDVDKGGYDSYVFPVAESPLWNNLPEGALRMFNGGFGGVIVPEYDLEIKGPHTILARCGLGLRVVAVARMEYGRGTIVVSQLQLSLRLNDNATTGGPFDYRPDPVARQLLVNLVSL